jgi:nitroreductase
MDTFDVLHKRRSVRAYTGESIPRSHLEIIVDAGRMAASGSNLQPWVFIVVTNAGMISKLSMAAAWMKNAAAIIAVVMDPSSRWWLEDGSAAVQNMQIAATALGYGSCWLEGRTRAHEDELKQLLGIPEDRRLMTLLPVGVPVEWPEKEKKSLSDVMRWEKWESED